MPGEIILIIFVALMCMFWPRLIGGAEWAPASMRIVRKMLAIAKVTRSDIVYDLGCGDGRFIVSAIKDFHAKKAVGIEIDPMRFLISKFRTRNLKNAKILFGNFLKKDMRKATIITCFLRQNTNDSLKKKFSKLKKGTKIVSYIWKFSRWKPSVVDEKNRIRLFIIGKT